MSKITISLSADDKKPDAITRVESVSKSKPKGSKAKSPRQQFFSELMKRLAGDSGNAVAEAYKNDRHKFKGMMMSIIGDMAKVEKE